jgi:AraC-like DNA-binding protein
MSEPAGGTQRWAQLSVRPRLLCSSARAGWRGFEFQEIEVPENGTFDVVSEKPLGIFQTCGPMKVRYGGSKTAFVDFPTYPQISFPDNPSKTSAGAWKGSQRGLHLFLQADTIEKFDDRPFRQDAFAKSEGSNPTIALLLSALHIDVVNGHPSGPLLGETIVAAMLNSLLSKETGLQRPSQRKDLSLGELSRLREWIDANLAEPFNLEDLAREARVSVRHLHRAFPSAIGMSPYKYILTRRVDRARVLIEAGIASLSEIAALVGFCDQAHMAHTFRKVLKVSPSYFCKTRK